LHLSKVGALRARLLRRAAARIVGVSGILPARPAHGAAQELGLVLHHVEPLAATALRGLARGRFAGFDDRLRLGLGRCGLARGVAGFLATLVPLGPVIAMVGALEAPVAEARVVVAIVLLAAVLAPVVAALVTPFIPSLVAPFVTAFTPFVGATVLVTRLRLGLWLLAWMAREGGNGGLLPHARIGWVDLAIVARFAHVGAVRAVALAVAIRGVAALLHLLLAIRDDHAIVVFGVLKVILGEDGVAGGLCVPGKGDVLGGDVRRRAPDFDIRPIRLEAARERVLPFAVVMSMTAMIPMAAIATAAAAATPAAMLLTLPHRLPFFPRRVRACSSTPEP